MTDTPARRSFSPGFIPAILGVIFLGAFLLLRAESRGGKAATAEGQLADLSWPLADLEGKPTTLAGYRGKAVFLNIWATWCAPCVAELPSIARLAADPRLKDVAFVCVSIDEDPAAVARFLDGKSLPMSVLHARGPSPGVFSTEGIPATFLIGPDAVIRRQVVGGMDWDTPEMVGQLERLAAHHNGGNG